MPNDPQILIVVDTREQRPYRFSVPTVTAALPAGDYSVCGLECRIAVERKSLADLLQSITRGRARFERELAKAKSYARFFVVCECSPSDILEGRYDAQVHPAAAWESICTFSVRHCPFVFAESREIGARLVESILVKYAREFWNTVQMMEKAASTHRMAEERAVDNGNFPETGALHPRRYSPVEKEQSREF